MVEKAKENARDVDNMLDKVSNGCKRINAKK